MRAGLFSRSNGIISIIVVLFAAYVLSPLYFNINEPTVRGPQNECDLHLRNEKKELPIDPNDILRPNNDIKIIRLTNAGEFADRCELTNALYELNWDRPRPLGSNRPAVKEGAISLPKLVLLYVHGWKHSADPSDSNRIEFEKFISAIRERERGKRHVVGIYVGWNADAPLWGVLEHFTFWVKKNNADRIAQSSALTLIVSAVGSIVHSDPDRQDQFIPIGHSFGARMLYSATAQPIISAAAKAHPGHNDGTFKLIRGFADSVILLNPAIEASHYSALNGFGRGKEKFHPKQPPIVIAISTEGDVATKRFFPIGQFLGLAQTARERTTFGNYKPFWTHSLHKGACSGNATGKITEEYDVAGLCLRRVERKPSDSLDGSEGKPEPQVVTPHNPFIVAQTTIDIIKDHNDIWNPVFRNWFVELIVSLKREHEAVQSQ